MDVANRSFWEELAEAANRNPAMLAKGWHLEACTFGFEISEARHVLELHRGVLKLLDASHVRGARFTIRGPRDEWERLTTGQIPFAQAVNIRHGKLRADGDALCLTWMTPSLWELFRVSARLRAGERTDA